MHDRAGQVAFVEVRLNLLHKLAVTDIVGQPVDDRADSAAGQLLDLAEAGRIYVFAVCFDDRLGHRVMRAAFCQRGDIDQHVGVDLIRMHGVYGKRTLRDGAGFVEDDSVNGRKRFQIVAALDEDAATAGRPDPTEKAQWHGDHEGARARDDEEDQAAVDAAADTEIREDRAKGGDDDRQDYDDRGIVMSEFRDKTLGFGFFVGGVFDQFEDPRHRAVFVLGRSGDLDCGREVDAARVDGIAFLNFDRQTFACQRCGVEGRCARANHAVDRNLFAGLDQHGFTDLYLRRVDFFLGSVAQNDGRVGANVHHCSDRLAALADCNALEKLSDLVEQHDGRGFGVFSDGKSTDCGDHHEEFFVEKIACSDFLDCTFDDVKTYYQVGDEVQRDQHDRLYKTVSGGITCCGPAREGVRNDIGDRFSQKIQNHQQARRHKDPD